MQSYIPQTLTVDRGYATPQLLIDAGLKDEFQDTMELVDGAYRRLHQELPQVAQYLVTHAHYRRVLSQMNLRQCYHLFKLRISPQAHESIRNPMQNALDQARAVHPNLFQGIQIRE